ncbi:DUF488 domain-containing protein [Pyxidicoccus parkwayensis]|uniref:DUF488 domain-containing protein n=1 Tax=Pyxidicoccus parkwayensis TaxID=2813578 RepID=A0ABX7NQR2_9BACT|nr:DUF488 domain-containing protein [Pyxidicoccus parkwaysis]QSQ20709.1 DUF488 domain-containing protein [Pyxidicoccus parkwaysis]
MTHALPKRAWGWGRAHVFAVGHSTRTADELVAMLEAHGVRGLADIRTVPRSRTNPQFNLDTFGRTLRRVDIHHVHLARLGGLRRPRKDSPNTAWRNRSFQGYADYMQTEEFAHGLEELRVLTREGPVALMCAEALRWRCHRSLVADALWARGVVVQHILSATRTEPHHLTAFAKVRGKQVLYPGSPDEAKLRPEADEHAAHV